MDAYFESQIKELREKVRKLIRTFSKAIEHADKLKVTVSEDFRRDFFSLVDKVNLSLMEDKDNFYGYFLFQMAREIRFDISSPTAVNFRGAKYVIYFNPLMFLELNPKQMEAAMKHEILHIISMHLPRAKSMKGCYHNQVINMAMDIVVNKYIDNLPSYATTLEWVNAHYSLNLEPYASFEYYADQLQAALALPDIEKAKTKDDVDANQPMETEYDTSKTHDLWEESSDIDERTMKDFTEKAAQASEKGELPTYVQQMISSLKNGEGELPWNLYLNRLMGTVESVKKKTVTRRNRRQPDRLDLRGELRSHKANIAVAIDISGSMSDEEFKQALEEVLSIVKNYNHEITLIECDDEIRCTYKINSMKDIKDRSNAKGGTKYSPVIEYANQNKFNLLVYFTDGKGEAKLQVIPRGYQILWVISGRGDELSLKEPHGTVKKLSKVEINDNILDASDVASGGFSMNHQEKN